jgi:NAD(P)-dependent dehydrogenase (short-subunit alcohol dehydrogenase family)
MGTMATDQIPAAPQPPFEGKSALIFGSGRNIGRAIAIEFARRGARVAVADIDSPGAEETAQLIIAAGGQATALRCDVSNDDSVRNAATAAQDRLGEIDIVMNNAGILHSGNPEDFPIEEWQRMFNINFMAIVRSSRIFVPKMIARGHGYIVNTASFAGLYPYATNRIPYAASKAAIVSLSENLAIYLIPKGIRVSCLCPGPTMTTSMQGMKPFSANTIMRGPGSDLKVKSQEEVARILCDGMRDARIIIPTHEQGLETVRQRGSSMDGFIQQKIREFARGDSGLPSSNQGTVR